MSKSIQFKDKNNEKFYPHPYYPVGSIYLSVNDTNPATWFGGTWIQIAKGRTLVGVDTNDADFNTVQKTGGSKYIQDHKHIQIYVKDATGTGSGEQGAKARNKEGNNGGVVSGSDFMGGVADKPTGDSGNLQPYFTCYIWCRTA